MLKYLEQKTQVKQKIKKTPSQWSIPGDICKYMHFQSMLSEFIFVITLYTDIIPFTYGWYLISHFLHF